MPDTDTDKWPITNQRFLCLAHMHRIHRKAPDADLDHVLKVFGLSDSLERAALVRHFRYRKNRG